MSAERKKSNASPERQKQAADESKQLVERLATKERELAQLEREMTRFEEKRRREAAVETASVTSSSEILRRIDDLAARVSHLDQKLDAFADVTLGRREGAARRPRLLAGMLTILLVVWFVIEVL